MTQIPKTATNVVRIAAGLTIMVAAVGCGSSPSEKTSSSSATDQKKAIQTIQNNPNMPPEAKAAAIASLTNPPGAGPQPGSKKK
jgi:hypothetical protein